jgi:hypothetical protein
MKELKEASIIIELVLIGFQVLIWFFLLTVTIFGYGWLDLSSLAQWSAELSVGLVGVAYMFGLIFDKAVSSLPYSWIVGGSHLTGIGDGPSPLVMRMEILTRKPEIFDVVEKRLNQHRLVRASVFNLALISLSALAFLLVRFGFDLKMFLVLVALSVLFVSLALFTGRRSAETLYFELLHLYEGGGGSGHREADSDQPELRSADPVENS